MSDLLFPYAKTCKKCGKEIFVHPQWVYKRDGNHYCSWTCFRADEKTKHKRKIIRPHIGDTIRIKYISGIPEYTGKEGVVEFYDCFGQIHGTWGKFVLIPEEDIIEIIGEKDDE